MYIADLTRKTGSFLACACLFLAVAVAIAPVAHARDSAASPSALECDLRFTKHDLAKFQKQLEQYLRWNEQANGKAWLETTDFISLQAAAIPVSTLNVQMAPDLNLDIAQALGLGTNTWLIPKHPYNTDAKVAFSNHPAVATLRARFMASRSLIIWPEGHTPFSIKVGTNFPHRTDQQDYKALMEKDIRVGIPFSQMVAQLDASMKPAEHIKILREVLALSDPKTGEGAMVRDLSPLLDGHYYLPAFSIPYVGQEIAAKFGQPFKIFWKEHYAKALGRAKAELLLRYGLQFDEANAQNIVAQLDENMMPTGRFVFFDLSGMTQVEQFFRTPEMRVFVSRSVKDMTPFLKPDSHNSVWQMDEGGVPVDVTLEWQRAHDEAYVAALRAALPQIPALKPPGQTVAGPPPSFDSAGEARAIGEFLSTAGGQSALAKYRADNLQRKGA